MRGLILYISAFAHTYTSVCVRMCFYVCAYGCARLFFPINTQPLRVDFSFVLFHLPIIENRPSPLATHDNALHQQDTASVFKHLLSSWPRCHGNMAAVLMRCQSLSYIAWLSAVIDDTKKRAFSWSIGKHCKCLCWLTYMYLYVRSPGIALSLSLLA